MNILDSSVLVAYFRKSEENHEKAKAIIYTEVENGFLITDYVLSEIYTVILNRDNYDNACKALNWMMLQQGFSLTRLTKEEIASVIDFLSENKSKLSFVDASLIILAKTRKAELFTFDKELDKVYKGRR